MSNVAALTEIGLQAISLSSCVIWLPSGADQTLSSVTFCNLFEDSASNKGAYRGQPVTLSVTMAEELMFLLWSGSLLSQGVVYNRQWVLSVAAAAAAAATTTTEAAKTTTTTSNQPFIIPTTTKKATAAATTTVKTMLTTGQWRRQPDSHRRSATQEQRRQKSNVPFHKNPN